MKRMRIHTKRTNSWLIYGRKLREHGTLLGPYTFDGNINGYNYLEMINDFTLQCFWWFQDEAPAHLLRKIRHRLYKMLANCVAVLYNEVGWPLRSPDRLTAIFPPGLLEIKSFCHLSTRSAGSAKSNSSWTWISGAKSKCDTQCC